MDHIHTFWPHKDTEGFPGWVISPMPGPPPRQHKHERQDTPGTHSFIPTRRKCNDDYDGRMIVGDLGGLKCPDISLTGGEKPRKNLTRETCPDHGSNPGPLRDKRACYHLLHSGGPHIPLVLIEFNVFRVLKPLLHPHETQKWFYGFQRNFVSTI